MGACNSMLNDTTAEFTQEGPNLWPGTPIEVLIAGVWRPGVVSGHPNSQPPVQGAIFCEVFGNDGGPGPPEWVLPQDIAYRIRPRYGGPSARAQSQQMQSFYVAGPGGPGRGSMNVEAPMQGGYEAYMQGNGRPGPSHMPGGGGKFQPGTPVEVWSNSDNRWIPAVVAAPTADNPCPAPGAILCRYTRGHGPDAAIDTGGKRKWVRAEEADRLIRLAQMGGGMNGTMNGFAGGCGGCPQGYDSMQARGYAEPGTRIPAGYESGCAGAQQGNFGLPPPQTMPPAGCGFQDSYNAPQTRVPGGYGQAGGMNGMHQPYTQMPGIMEGGGGYGGGGYTVPQTRIPPGY